MFSRSLKLHGLVFLALLTQAGAVAAAGDKLVPVAHFHNATTVTAYGANPNPHISRAPSASCGPTTVTCSSANAPDAASCGELFDWIDANGATRFETGVRALCSGSCCVRWADPVPGLAARDLLAPAREAHAACGMSSAAVASGVMLENVCTTLCLSSSPDKCPLD